MGSKDPVDMVLDWIRQGDLKSLIRVKDALPELMRSRNVGVIWPGLIDRGSTLWSTGKMEEAKKWLALFVEAKLPVNAQLPPGDWPVQLALNRSPGFATALLAYDVDPNVLDFNEKTPLLRAVKMIQGHEPNAAALGFAVELIRQRPVRFDFHDQGARAFFDALPWLANLTDARGVENSDQASEMAEKFIDAFIFKGFDINAPRLRQELSDPVKINTPLSFFIKRAHQWHEQAGFMGAPEKKRMVSRLVECLLDRGANPAFQLEKEARLALMRVCEQSAFEPGLAQRLEAAVLREVLAVPSGSGSGSRRGGRL